MKKSILILLIGLFYLALPANAKFYYPFQNLKIKEMSFLIEAPAIRKMLKQKMLLASSDSFHFEAKWLSPEQRLTVKLISSGQKISDSLKQKMTLILTNRMNEYFKGNIKRSLKDYRKYRKANYTKYTDNVGEKKVREVAIKKGKDKIFFTVKKPIGTNRVEYIFRKLEKKVNKKFLVEINYNSYVGLRNDRTQTMISYQKVKGLWIPFRISSKTSQALKVSKLDTYEVERYLEEALFFKQVKISKK